MKNIQIKLIKENLEYIYIIKPLETINFNFFNKGQDIILGVDIINLNENIYNYNSTTLTKFRFNIGIYTLNTNNYYYNLDIRKNITSGCLDVYIFESNIFNSQIIVENLSEEIILIYQNNYSQYRQNIYPQKTAILKIYDFIEENFTFRSNNSTIKINIGKIKKTQVINNNDIIVVFLNNGIRMKITIYSLKNYNNSFSKSINFNFNLYIKSIYISFIVDNEIEDPKLTKYDRNEFLLIYIDNFISNINIEQTIGISKKNLIHSEFIIENLQMINQLKQRGKFLYVLKNEKAPFINFKNDFEFYPSEKIINILEQKIYVQKMLLGIDPNFLKILITFFDNIQFRINANYLKINNAFIDKYNYDPNELINKYNKSIILINGICLMQPKLNIEFELFEKGLEELLKERIACSDFYIWIAKGLVGSVHELSIDSFDLDVSNITLFQYLIRIYYEYKRKIEDNLTLLKLNGIMGQIKYFFPFDLSSNEDDHDLQKKIIREIRPFFGKYKYYKEYDELEIFLLKNTYLKNSNLRNNYYPIKIIKGNKLFYLFTNISVFQIYYLNYTIKWSLDYFSIKIAKTNNNRVQVFYNQKIDNYESCSFQCESDEIAKQVAETINEEILKTKEDFLNL